MLSSFRVVFRIGKSAFLLALLSFAAQPSAIADEVFTRVADVQIKPGEPIPPPTGPVVLKISGNIGAKQNGRNVVEFDMATLEKLGVVRYTTPTNWTEQPVTFDGVLLANVLSAVGANPRAQQLVLVALNDYKVTVPASDSRTWPVMLATKENGNYMSVRERGPLWVVYPQHAFPELGNRDYLSRWVWQLAEIKVE